MLLQILDNPNEFNLSADLFTCTLIIEVLLKYMFYTFLIKTFAHVLCKCTQVCIQNINMNTVYVIQIGYVCNKLNCIMIGFFALHCKCAPEISEYHSRSSEIQVFLYFFAVGPDDKMNNHPFQSDRNFNCIQLSLIKLKRIVFTWSYLKPTDLSIRLQTDYLGVCKCSHSGMMPCHVVEKVY